MTPLLSILPGWLLITAIALLSKLLSAQIVVAGKQPVEAAVFAIVLGILIRNLNALPAVCEAGVKAFEKLLILGIVLIGASLNFTNLASDGAAVITIVLATMLIGFIAIYSCARIAKISDKLAILLAVGTTICGGTAIAIIAPIIDAKEEETSYAIGTIALWGLVAILLYPVVAQAIGASDVQFGIFAGTAIHSTPQVVGAGFIFSELAGKTATAVKLIRNCFLAPVALLVAAFYTGVQSGADISESGSSGFKRKATNVAKAFPWFLFGFFLMAWCNTQGYFTQSGIDAFSRSGKFFILLGMVGIGLNTRLNAIVSVGGKPLFIGCIGALIVAGTSLLMILFLH